MALLGGLVPGTVLTIGEAPSAAMAATYIAMANSIGLAMSNAVATQQRGQLTAAAATVKVVEFILECGTT